MPGTCSSLRRRSAYSAPLAFKACSSFRNLASLTCWGSPANCFGREPCSSTQAERSPSNLRNVCARDFRTTASDFGCSAFVCSAFVCSVPSSLRIVAACPEDCIQRIETDMPGILSRRCLRCSANWPLVCNLWWVSKKTAKRFSSSSELRRFGTRPPCSPIHASNLHAGSSKVGGCFQRRRRELMPGIASSFRSFSSLSNPAL
mmetsp:Transcript_50551/g.163686  ORF Transcript_50551/g.163686 Transcript_50551/m.163686 type:complete len:203 (+) Transcript_50551:1354-1962(+)